MKHLPTGAYQQGSSILHRMDATVKIVLLLILLVGVVTTNTLLGYGVLILFTAVCTAVSRIGVKAAVGSLGRMIWFFIVIFLMNLLFFKSDTAWARLWIFAPSYDGLMQGVKVVVRVAVLLVFCNILNVTTPPVAVTKAIENIMSPLKWFKIPTQQLALILSVAIQFIPTLFEEADMIKKAQTARGAKFYSRSLKDKAGAVLPMIVPIFVSAFRRADELSLAMEARGYRVDVQCTKNEPVHFGLAEAAALLLCTALCVLAITML